MLRKHVILKYVNLSILKSFSLSYLCVCVYATNDHFAQRAQKRALDPLELEL